VVPWVRETLAEYIRYGFIEKVDTIPYCVMPLQVKTTSDKTALIYDMSVLNDYVERINLNWKVGKKCSTIIVMPNLL
jgi:hypothetical protein